MSVKIRYFAWVREKTGKAEEIVDLPAGVDDRGRPGGVAHAARPGVR